MKFVVEFYRIRDADDAHAVVGREDVEAVDLEEAMRIARLLSRTLAMPQRPDAMAVSASEGGRLYSGSFDSDEQNC
jgi:hypothetical protein